MCITVDKQILSETSCVMISPWKIFLSVLLADTQKHMSHVVQQQCYDWQNWTIWIGLDIKNQTALDTPIVYR